MSTETIVIAVIAMVGTLGGGWFAFKQGYANTLNKRENDLWARIEEENEKLRVKLGELIERVNLLEEDKEKDTKIIKGLKAEMASQRTALEAEMMSQRDEHQITIEALTARIVELEAALEQANANAANEKQQRERAEEVAEQRRIEIMRLKRQRGNKRI